MQRFRLNAINLFNRKEFLKIIFGKEGFPNLGIVKVVVNETWCFVYLNVSPHIVRTYDTSNISHLTYCIVCTFVHLETFGYIEATNLFFSLFSSKEIGFSFHRVPQFNMIVVDIPSHNIGCFTFWKSFT